MKESFFTSYVVPMTGAFLMCAVLVVILCGEITSLNRFIPHALIVHARMVDVAVGLIIYLKTSVDFALYMGHLMSRNRGWKSRIAIETGTALGNAVGTLLIIVVWSFFKDIRWLLALMITLASLVLFRLAEEGVSHVSAHEGGISARARVIAKWYTRILHHVNALIAPVLRYVLPDMRVKDGEKLRFWPLFSLAFTIPFMLGLDDFAGYVPLFSIVNVFGFAIGVFVGHMALNMVLYASPAHTIRIVRNRFMAWAGSVVFVGLGVWGLIEVARLIGI